MSMTIPIFKKMRKEKPRKLKKDYATEAIDSIKKAVFRGKYEINEEQQGFRKHTSLTASIYIIRELAERQ